MPEQAAAGLLVFWGGEEMRSWYWAVQDAVAVAWSMLLPHNLGSTGGAGPGAGWMHEQPSPAAGFCKDPGHLRSYCRSRCCSLHDCSFVHLYAASLDSSFLELTPSPALFPGQKGLVHLQAALQHASAVCVLLFAGAVCGIRVQGAASCLPKTLAALETPPKSPCSQQPLSTLSQENSDHSFYFWMY